MTPILLSILALFGIGAAAAFLHRQAVDWGYGPFFLFVGALNVAMWATAQRVYVTAAWPLPVASVILFPILLACLLLVYAVDGTDRARLLAGAMFVVVILYQVGSLLIEMGSEKGWLEIASLEGWNLSVRISIASAFALLIDLALLVSLHQSIVNRFGKDARIPAFFVALFAALLADAIVFPIIAFGPTADLVSDVWAHLAGKVTAALLLTVPFGLRIVAVRSEMSPRPVFDFFLPPWDTLSRDLDAEAGPPRVPLETLFRSATHLGRELDLDQVAASIIQEGRRVLRVDQVGLFLRDPGRPGVLVAKAGLAAEGEEGMVLPLDGSVASPAVTAFVERRVVTRFLAVARRARPGKAPFDQARSLLAVPLEGIDGPFGALLFASAERKRFFGATDVALASAFAGHAASAITNAERVSRIVELSKAVAEREDRLRIVVEQIPAVFWVANRDLVITLSTGSGLKRIGLRPGELVGRAISSVVGKAIDDPEARGWRAVQEALTGESSNFEEAFGGRTWQSHVEPLRGERGEVIGVLGLAIDITELAEAERRLGESRDEVAAYQDLMTHDLANFSTTLLGLLDFMMVASTPPLDPMREELIQRANRQAWELNRLVENARLLARLKERGLPATVEKEPFRVLLGRIESTLRTVHFDTPFELRVEGDDADCECRIPFFENVLLNLVDNAIRHARPPGSGPTVIRLGVSKRPGNGVRVSVVGGRPVPPEQISQMFTRYVRGAHSGGAGLGLALVREIVGYHGGTASARIEGEGTEQLFAVDLELPGR